MNLGSFKPPGPPEVVVGDSDEVVGVVSLSDRRRIAELEKQLTMKDGVIAQLQGRMKPALERPGWTEESCWHDGGCYVFEKEPRVTCKLCGRDLDPMVVLRKIAHQEINFCYAMDALKRERKDLVEEVEKLKRVRSNMKRSIRRAETGK